MKESWKCRSGRDNERTVFLRADGRGGKTSRAFSGDEGEAGESDRDMVVPAWEAAAFEMVEAELALEVLVDPLGAPAFLQQVDQESVRNATVGGEVEMCRPFLTVAPLAHQPQTFAATRLTPIIDRAIQSARRAFEGKEWGGMELRSRARLVNHLADALEARLPDLFRLETTNNGRPVNETRAQISRLPDFFRYNAGLALSRRDAVVPVEGPYLAYTRRTPIGVVGNSTPFNHPLMILCKSLAPVLASGCTTVVKPSEYTPLTTLELARIFTEAGLPPGVFNVVTGLGPTTGKALAQHPGLNKFVLTGGTDAGRIVGGLAGANFARQTLELGGKTPVLVFDDYDLEQAVNYAAFGAFVGAGQTCICASRHLVQRSIYAEFVERLAAKAKTLRLGDPADPKTQLGPVISDKQRRRVLSYVEAGLAEGAKLVAGGRIPDAAALGNPRLAGGFFVEPTVFADVTPPMKIARDEVFGPFTVILPFEDEAEAIRIANDSPYGLAAAIRTSDVARAHRVAAALRCGIVWVNDHHRLDPALPWGGVKESGVGCEFGTESFDDHFDVKTVMINTDGRPFDWYRETAGQKRLN